MVLRTRCQRLDLSEFPERREITGRFRDVDARNHLNNIAVAELFSEARTQFIHACFSASSRPDKMYFVVGQQAVFYANEAHYPGKIEIGTGLFAIGRSTLRFGQVLFNRGRCAALGESVLVCTVNGRATPLTPEFSVQMQDFLLDSNLVPRQLTDID